jgi:hypothetical protein
LAYRGSKVEVTMGEIRRAKEQKNSYQPSWTTTSLCDFQDHLVTFKVTLLATCCTTWANRACSFSYTQHYELSSYMANDELSVVSRALFAICVCSSSPPGIIVSKIVSCRFAQTHIIPLYLPLKRSFSTWGCLQVPFAFTCTSFLHAVLILLGFTWLQTWRARACL